MQSSSTKLKYFSTSKQSLKKHKNSCCMKTKTEYYHLKVFFCFFVNVKKCSKSK